MIKLRHVQRALHEILQSSPANFRLLNRSKRNSNFVFLHQGKTWITKIYGTPPVEMKPQKEYFFIKHIYPILYPNLQSKVLYFGPSTLLDDHYVMIREYIDAEPILSINETTLIELVSILKIIHKSPKIRAVTQEFMGFEFDRFGEVMGATNGISNTHDISQYFNQALEHWLANIKKSGFGKHEIKTAILLQEIMNDRLGIMPTKPALTHGDVKVGNLMRLMHHERFMIIDFESAFSFLPEYDFVTLLFAREVDRFSETVPCLLSHHESVDIILEHYYQNSVSRTIFQEWIHFLSSYAYLRLWNFAIRIKQSKLANEVIRHANNYVQKFS
jgi:aminoglycoside phosphotransferase (APT) family kinase protein